MYFSVQITVASYYYNVAFFGHDATQFKLAMQAMLVFVLQGRWHPVSTVFIWCLTLKLWVYSRVNVITSSTRLHDIFQPVSWLNTGPCGPETQLASPDRYMSLTDICLFMYYIHIPKSALVQLRMLWSGFCEADRQSQSRNALFSACFYFKYSLKSHLITTLFQFYPCDFVMNIGVIVSYCGLVLQFPPHPATIVVTHFSKSDTTSWSPECKSRCGCWPRLLAVYANASTEKHTTNLKSHNKPCYVDDLRLLLLYNRRTTLLALL